MILTQARLLITGVVILAVLALGGYVWLTRKSLAEARARVVTAEQQSDLNAATTEATDRYHTSTIVIQKEGEREVQIVQAIPGAQTPLDTPRRDGLCAALGRLRDGAEACSDPSVGEPAEAL